MFSALTYERAGNITLFTKPYKYLGKIQILEKIYQYIIILNIDHFDIYIFMYQNFIYKNNHLSCIVNDFLYSVGAI